MKSLLLKILVVSIIAVVCGAIVAVLFSLSYYGLFPQHRLADAYLADTPAKAKLRFWLAFAAGAVFGIVWSYRMVKEMEL